MKLSTKLYIGAGVLSLFIAGLAFFNIQTLSKMVRIYEINNTVAKAKEDVVKIQSAVDTFHNDLIIGANVIKSSELLQNVDTYHKAIHSDLEQVRSRTTDATVYSELQKLQNGIKNFTEIVNNNATIDEQNAQHKNEIAQSALTIKNKIDEILHGLHRKVEKNNSTETYKLMLKIIHDRELVHNVSRIQARAIETGDDKLFKEIKDAGEKFVRNFEKLADRTSNYDDKVQILKVIDDVNNYMQLFIKTQENVNLINRELVKMGDINKQIDGAISTLSSYCNQLASDVATKSLNITTMASVIFVVLLLLFSLIAVRSITKPILKITEELQEFSEHVAGSSIEIQSASESLASSATEQSSAVTETSASVEELDGMVRNNLDNAEKSLEVADRTMNLVSTGNELVEQLQQATEVMMEGNAKIEGLVNVISAIGEKTKIIDEIVFQTKLLSFNASVEAERAGEHGRGFAVVAQEVGNLAKLSGTAALEIAEIVKSSIEQATELTAANNEKFARGAEIVGKVASMFNEIKGETETVKVGSHGVREACEEQALGIEQINVAISEIDKATQAISSAAEQNSGSSKKLKDIAVAMKDSVNALAKVILGNEDLERVRTANKLKAEKKAKKVETKVAKKVTPVKKVEVKKTTVKKVEVKKAPISQSQPEPKEEDFVVLQNNVNTTSSDGVPLTANDKSWDDL